MWKWVMYISIYWDHVPLSQQTEALYFQELFFYHVSFWFCSLCSVPFSKSANSFCLLYYSYPHQCTLIVLTCFMSLISCYYFIQFFLFCISFCAFKCVNCISLYFYIISLYSIYFLLSTCFSLILRCTVLFKKYFLILYVK